MLIPRDFIKLLRYYRVILIYAYIIPYTISVYVCVYCVCVCVYRARDRKNPTPTGREVVSKVHFAYFTSYFNNIIYTAAACYCEIYNNITFYADGDVEATRVSTRNCVYV